MPVKVQTLFDRPIILATSFGFFTRDDARHIFARSHALIQNDTRHYFRITDARYVQCSAQEMESVLAVVTEGVISRQIYDRVTPVFVGDSPWIEMAQAYLQDELGIDAPNFPTVDEALCYIKSQLN